MTERNYNKGLPIVNTIIGTLAVLVAILSIKPELLKSNTLFYIEPILPFIPLMLILSLLIAQHILVKKINALSNYADKTIMKISQFYPNRNDPEFKSQYITAMKTAREILCIGIGNNQIVRELDFDFYRQFSERNGRMKLMFLNPSGIEIKKRELAEGRQVGSLSHNVTENLAELKKLKQQFSLTGNIRCVFYDCAPGINAIIIDKKIAFIHYYSQHNKGADAPVFIITDQDPHVLNFFLVEVSSTWNEWSNNNKMAGISID